MLSLPMIRTCPTCRSRNRVQARHLANIVRCGSCKTTLGAVAEPLEVDASTFAEVTRAAHVPVLVDFWAAWCGPCRAAAPLVSQLARDMAGHALVLKVDTEREPELSAQYGVRSIPNFVLLKEGAVVSQHAGLAPREEMRRWIEEAARTR